MIYNKGIPKIKEHNHFPYCISFIYYINVPDNAANIYFNGIEYKIKEGVVIVFPSNLFHYIEENNVDNRICLVGNIGYDISDLINKKYHNKNINNINIEY